MARSHALGLGVNYHDVTASNGTSAEFAVLGTTWRFGRGGRQHLSVPDRW